MGVLAMVPVAIVEGSAHLWVLARQSSDYAESISESKAIINASVCYERRSKCTYNRLICCLWKLV